MGLLDVAGAPLEWTESKKYSDHVRKHGVQQFIQIYKNYEGKKDSILRWGDEVSPSSTL